MTIKLTDQVISTDPVQKAKSERGPSAQSVGEQSLKESSLTSEILPIIIKGKVYDGVTNVEIVQLVEALPFLEAAKSDLLEAIDSHE